MSARLHPVEAPFAPDVAAILARYPQQGGYLLALFRTFANSKRFLEKGVPHLLDAASPLGLRAREIVILRVTANLGCEYEWGVHVAAFARAAGLGDDHVAATRLKGPDAPLWNEAERALIRAVDELCEQGHLSDAAQASFEQAFSLEQQLEILALCGAYHTVSFVANVARLPLEPFAARFPSPAQ